MSSSRRGPIRIGILGFGTVGEGTYRMLRDNQESVRRKLGVEIEVAKIGIRDEKKPRSLPKDIFTTDLRSITDDPKIEAVLELIGGEQPALDLVGRCLEQGKHVVTANKELIAKHGSALLTRAKRLGLELHFEAAVGGGIPIVQPLKHQLAGNDVLRMMGILNGTTNHILTEMRTKGASFESALVDAQKAGYAEADPTSDVDGFDTMYKVSILASIVFGRQAPLAGIHREGIRGVGSRDFEAAALLGFTIKLLGICEALPDGRALIRVHPALVPNGHQLASVEGVYNALWLQGDFVGDLMFSGRGAGASPTASAVVGDLIDVGRNILAGNMGTAIPYGEGLVLAPISELESRYYMRLTVADKPNTLGRIATLFGEHGVGLAAMEMKGMPKGQGEIAFMTHACREESFVAALDLVAREEVVAQVESWMRVVE